jgi:uncharacterized membrane protein
MPTSPSRYRARKISFLVSLFLTGLVAGGFLIVQLGQVAVQKTLPARDFVLVKQTFEVPLGAVMPPLMILTVLSLCPLLYLIRDVRTKTFRLAAICLVLWAAAVVTTLIFNIPVNEQTPLWDPGHPPEDWAALRDQWNTGHTIRTLLTVPAFALLLATALFDEPPPP